MNLMMQKINILSAMQITERDTFFELVFNGMNPSMKVVEAMCDQYGINFARFHSLLTLNGQCKFIFGK
jgi:hypothetical protein